MPEFICDAVNLEGINYTLPEVQTLLEGVTIGGHAISDQIITLNQANAWKFLFSSLEDNSFELTKNYVCELHKIAAKDEALEWETFRSGSVTIAGTDFVPPNVTTLTTEWDKLIKHIDSITDLYDKAITLFLQMSRNQFFYDVNKRMGRFIMNGVLLNSGYPAINLPAKKQEQFNKLMLEFYDSNKMPPMVQFMKECIDPRIVSIMSE